MDPLTIAAIIALGFVGVLAAKKKQPGPAPPTTPPPEQPTPRFRGALRQNQLYRVWARVSPELIESIRIRSPQGAFQSYLTQEVGIRTEKSGFSGTLLITQDPTESTVFTVLTRWSLSSSEAYNSPPDFRLFQLQAVEEPPITVTMIQPDPPLSLDNGLTFNEVEAIRFALARDEDPKHLGGFASTLEPDYPVAASLLRAKEKFASAARMGPVIAGERAEKHQKNRERFRQAANFVGFSLSDPVEWAEKAVGDTIDALKDLTKDLGKTVQDAWDKYGGIVEVMGGWVPGPQIWAAELAYKVAKDISEGKEINNVLGSRVSEQGQRFAKGMQATSPFVAMIPGLGQGVAMMMNAASALALAQPLEGVLLDSIAMLVPGGGVAQTAFKSAAHMGTALLRGERIDQAALEGARAALPSDEARVAFDAGLALARGKSLQDAGFQALYGMTKGNDILNRSIHFAEAVIRAKQQGKSVKDVIIDEFSEDLLKFAESKLAAIPRVKQFTNEIVKKGSLLQKFPQEIYEEYERRIPMEVIQAALAAVKEVAQDVRVVDQSVIDRLAPAAKAFASPTEAAKMVAFQSKATGLSQFALTKPSQAAVLTTAIRPLSSALMTFSPSALQLVSAVQKPQASLVIAAPIAQERMRTIVEGAARGQPDAKAAKESLERAAKALERHRWVEWYRKAAVEGA